LARITVKHCLICEDSRREPNSKVTLLGFYGVAPDVTILVFAFGRPIPRLEFFVIGEVDATGEVPFTPEIRDETGRVIAGFPESAKVPVTAAGEIQLGVVFQNIVFQEPGTYTFWLGSEGASVYETVFRLAHPPPGVTPT
jgi:hypothetical protein